jgi:5'-nucleotidase
VTTDTTTQAWLTDMDGVLVREGQAIPGAAEFNARLVERQRPFWS